VWVGMHCYERTSLARLSRARQDQWDKHFEPQQSLFHAGATSRTSKTFTASPGTADFRGRPVNLPDVVGTMGSAGACRYMGCSLIGRVPC
jgi:hypothetical protein